MHSQQKRPRTSPSPPPPPPATAPAAPPLSALAARRAAAQSKAPILEPTVIPSAEASASSSSSDEDDDDDKEEVAISSSEEEDVEEVEEANARMKIEKKKEKKRVRAGKKSVGKAGRYFAGAVEGNGRDQVKMVVDEDAESSTRTPAPERAKMGRGKRQRRERSAFVDPYCVSSFLPVWGQNAQKVDWKAVDGSGKTEEGMIFCLDVSETLIIHGSYNLSLLSGDISFFSSQLSTLSSHHSRFPPSTSSTHRVFSPSSHPLPSIVALQSTSSSTTPFTLPNGHQTSAPVVVLVWSLNSGIEGTEKVLVGSGMGVGNGMWPSSERTREVGWEGPGWKLITSPTPSLAALRKYEPWEAVLEPYGAAEESLHPDEGSERLVLLVEGPKRVGKSTFAKLLLNRLLSKFERVAYLDTDLGQPEFTAPGFVSLNVLSSPILGPSFTHLSIPFASHFLGSLSPASDPSSYLSAISSLISTYQLEVEFFLSPSSSSSSSQSKITDRIPLIINTQGWVKGLGADLLAKIKDEANPTVVFAFDDAPSDFGGDDFVSQPPPTQSSQTRPHGFLSGLTTEVDSSTSFKLHSLPPIPPSPLDTKWSPADLRTLSFISYFHSLLAPPLPSSSPSKLFPTRWDFSTSLIGKSPFEIDWRNDAGIIEKVWVLNEEIEDSQILWALNGNVVAIGVNREVGEEGEKKRSETGFPYDSREVQPNLRDYNTLGLGLVRSIDVEKKSLHLLTPVHSSFLEPQPVALIKGQLQLPLPLWLDSLSTGDQEKELGGVEWSKVPYLVANGDGGDGGRKRVRRNLMRRAHG